MMTAEERYRGDATFARLVDVIYAAIVEKQYTPTEVREAAMLAALKYDYTHIRDMWPHKLAPLEIKP